MAWSVLTWKILQGKNHGRSVFPKLFPFGEIRADKYYTYKING